PFYFSRRPRLIDGVPDHYVTLAAPVIAYWALCMFFHYLDTSDFKWLEKYRIHESTEVTSRNRATRTQVIWAVIFQHAIQTALGLAALAEEEEFVSNHEPSVQRIASFVPGPFAQEVAYYAYWWAIPFVQLICAMYVLIDTWQYFLHRWMHVNKWLYRHFHSWHHRLYVPYAFGALYNHPVEGFLLDSVGSVVAETCTFMTARQTMILFTLATFKTVDDHCGYRIPFDPLQFMTANNADYHDIHHQVYYGIKSNFAQPFFIHWDVILGTRMTRE
ncbi:fatty acid hydroxylase superfamily-domain-containing protein, partial [Mucidula mucida]